MPLSQKPSRSWVALQGFKRLNMSFWGETHNPSPPNPITGSTASRPRWC